LTFGCFKDVGIQWTLMISLVMYKVEVQYGDGLALY
jgi:hypothetical protein